MRFGLQIKKRSFRPLKLDLFFGGGGHQVIVQLTIGHHRDGIWKMSKESQVYEDAGK